MNGEDTDASVVVVDDTLIIPATDTEQNESSNSDDIRENTGNNEEPPGKKQATAAVSGGHARVPAIAEFGRFPPGEQLARWQEWLALFSAALDFAPGWSEQQKSSYVAIAGGQGLRDVINLFKLVPEGM